MSDTEITTRPPEAVTADFHRAFGLPLADQPTMPTGRERKVRARLHVEEVAELVAELLAGELDSRAEVDMLAALFVKRAMPTRWEPDLAAILRELADNQYVNGGTANIHGLPLTRAFLEVHRANMAKLGPDGRPRYSEHGKVLKPEGWQPPDIAAVLAGTTTRPGIRPVTYWEVWCTGNDRGGHLIEFGDYTGWSDQDGAESAVDDGEHVLLRDGRVFCWAHIPASVCPDSEDNRHEPTDDHPDECAHCGKVGLTPSTPQAVTA